MFGLVLGLSAALAMSPKEAVDAAIARAPALGVSDARIAEAESRLREATGHMLPSATLTAALVAQTKIEVDMTEQIELPFPVDAEPLLVQPGLQLQGGVSAIIPIAAPTAWAGREAAKEGIEAAEAERAADEVRVARRTLEAWHQAAFAHAMLEDARRTEELATRLSEKGDSLLRLGAVAEADVIPFRRAEASARASTALAEQAVLMADGVLRTLTGLDGVADAPLVPAGPPSVDELIAAIDRPDLRAAEQRIEAARRMVGVERSGAFPSVALTGQLTGQNPAADFFEPVVWRVGVGASIPLFQGGVIAAKVDGAQADLSAAEAGMRAAREGAEIEVRIAHGALASAIASLESQEEAVRLAREATDAQERRVDQGGGSLLDLQQAQLEQSRAEFQLTRARAEAAQAADLLSLAVKGSL